MAHRKGTSGASEKRTVKEIFSDCVGIIVSLLFCCLCGIRITVGAVYIYDCSLQSMIPISMIVSGLLPVFLIVSGNRNKKESKFTGFLCGLIALLLNIVWTVAESAWVYPAWDTWKSRGNVSCAASEMNCKSCNEALLKFAVAMVTLDWIFLAIITTYIFCVVYTQLSL